MSWASFASPSMTGMIGCSPGSRSKPASAMAARKRPALATSCSRSLSPSGQPAAVGAAGDAEGLERRAADGGREGVGEEVRPGPLLEQGHDLGRGADEAAHGPAQRLAEGAGDEVDLDPVVGV